MSLIEEDAWGCTCSFNDTNNLRDFTVTIHNSPGDEMGAMCNGVTLMACSVWFTVHVPNMYPRVSPRITFGGGVGGGRVEVMVDDKRTLVDDALVGNGWKPIQGLHCEVIFVFMFK